MVIYFHRFQVCDMKFLHLMILIKDVGIYLTATERLFNESMKLPRLTVEWGFMRVTQLWPAFQRPAFLQVYRQPLGQMYAIAVLLTNLRTCMTGRNLISDFFSCAPPCPEVFLLE